MRLEAAALVRSHRPRCPRAAPAILPGAFMKTYAMVSALALAAIACTGVAFAQGTSAATAPPAAAAKPPPDPWPTVLDLKNGQVLVYQPQVNSWDGNRIDFRSALAIKPTGATDESFGVIFANARTQVDKVARTVVFQDMKITKTDFPTLPNRGAAYTAE